MPFKLFQAEQNLIINQLPNSKVITPIRNNNNQSTQYIIAKNDFMYIFTSLEISFSRKFKKYMFNNSCFASRFCLFFINEIHLVEQ